MLRNRQEGLISLHGIWVTIMATGTFYVFGYVIRKLGLIRLTADFNATLYLLATLLGVLLALRAYRGWGTKLARLGWFDSAYITLEQIARMALVLFGMAFAIKDSNVSRLFLGSYLALVAVLLTFANRYLPGLIARVVFKSASIPTIVIGSPAKTPGFQAWLEDQHKLGVDVVGRVLKEGDTGEGLKVLGQVADLAAILEKTPVVQIVLPLFYLDAHDTKHVMAVARELGCRVKLVENFSLDASRPLSLEHTGSGVDVIGGGEEPLANPVNRSIKRLFDIAIALPVVLFVMPPLTLVVAIMQRIQAPGPVFYRQLRYGENRKPFLIFKFRSMYVASQNAATEKVQATKGDSRVYSFGRILRKTSLDEFPQFLNVLFGEMSVAGPRPHLTQHDEEFARLVSDYRMRHFVKPGITGLAQSHGYRGEITNSSLLLKRVAHDIDYVRSWTPIMDIGIMLRTARQVIFPPKSAY
jgi:exopolysaccharide biosynthesis polyprenyl glycosylphosphotransferase